MSKILSGNLGITCAAAAGDICGEGAVWHPDREVLYWVDINRFLLHEYDPDSETTRTWHFNEPVTSANLTQNPETLLLVFASRIGYWNARTHPRVDALYELKEAPAMRFNDAGVAPDGVLWAGTMANNVGAEGEEIAVDFKDGVLCRIDGKGRVTEWKRDIGISNTFAWSLDATSFYFGDTIANTLYRYDYDRRLGVISGERSYFSGFERGVPDGSAIDEDGFLWNARPGAGCIVRIAPDGRVDGTVELPVERPTTCAFGGPNLDIVYVTSARSAQRLSGSLFAFQPGVRGVPASRFRKY